MIRIMVGMATLALQMHVMAAIFVSPTGIDNAAGTLLAPTTLSSAITKIAAGDTIFVRAGTYALNTQITIDRTNTGAAGALKHIFAYNGEKPILDFSSEPYTSDNATNQRGIQINGHYWHIKGLEVVNAADNGIFIGGNNNIVELCVIHGNRDSGLQISRYASTVTDNTQWPSNNLVLNCEAYDNYDSPPQGTGENADGIDCKLTAGIGNVFRGCWSHNNIDDGFDLFTKNETGPIGPVTIDQCIASNNGTLTDGTSSSAGDRNGFKLGGDKISVGHIVTRCVAFQNGKNGFTWNSNPGPNFLANNLGIDNVQGNFKFGDNSTMTQAVFTNNVSFWTNTDSAQTDKYQGTDVGNTNCWWDHSKKQPSINGKGLIVTMADFANSLVHPTVSRNSNGSLNFNSFRLASGSPLINAGVIPTGAALPFDAATYYVGAPDLGAVENGAATGIKSGSYKTFAIGIRLTKNQAIASLYVPKAGAIRMIVFDMAGKIAHSVEKKNIGEGYQKIDIGVPGIQPGVYTIEIVMETYVRAKNTLVICNK